MDEPVWIGRRFMEQIYRAAIATGGGTEGLRDSGLLDAALARPCNLYTYGVRDIFQLAASYAEALARNHPFIDGNKRAGFAAADMFLLKNGYDLRPSDGDEHADMIEALARGMIGRDDAARHFERHCRPVAQD